MPRSVNSSGPGVPAAFGALAVGSDARKGLLSDFLPPKRPNSRFPRWAEKVPVDTFTGHIRPFCGYCRDTFGATLARPCTWCHRTVLDGGRCWPRRQTDALRRTPSRRRDLAATKDDLARPWRWCHANSHNPKHCGRCFPCDFDSLHVLVLCFIQRSESNAIWRKLRSRYMREKEARVE